MKFPARMAQHVVFRAVVALLFLALHLYGMKRYAWNHLGQHWNNAPDDPPTFTTPDYTWGATNWNRLIFSRWDSGQYIAMALDDIYGHCPTADLRHADLTQINSTCDLPFFPAYSVLGWAASWGTKYPVDYALWGVSLVASFFLLFLWTGPVVVRALGVWGAYLSLFLFNIYTTGFTLVTVLTEPCTMLFSFAAFVCLEKRRFWLAAVCAGTASAMRISGVAASIAVTVAMLLEAWDAGHLSLPRWAKLMVRIPLSAWGLLAMMGYQAWRFSDPFIYSHAHAQAFNHNPKLIHFFWPDAAWIVKSMQGGVHDAAIAALMLLWFALGHRQGLRAFSRPTQAFLYSHTLVAFVLPIYGTAEAGYTGVTRYLLMLFGVFFAMASVLRRRPFALAVWCTISMWHYWNADLCFFLSHLQPAGMNQCYEPTTNAEEPEVPRRDDRQ